MPTGLELAGAALALLVLIGTALALRAAVQAPRCPPCGVTSEPLPSSLINARPVVLEVVYECPGCRRIVTIRRFGEWD